jgi:hypothetical protein
MGGICEVHRSDGLNAMIYIPNLIKPNSSGIQKFIGADSESVVDSMNLFIISLCKENRLTASVV